MSGPLADASHLLIILLVAWTKSATTSRRSFLR